MKYLKSNWWFFSVPPKLDEDLCANADVDRLSHYGQLYGASAANDVESNQEINPAFFFDDDIEENTQFCLGLFAKEKSFKEFRETGVHRIKVVLHKQGTTGS